MYPLGYIVSEKVLLVPLFLIDKKG